MSLDEITRRYYQLFNERRLNDAEQLVDPEATFHYLPTRQRLVGRAGYRALVGAWISAFADAQLEVQSVEIRDDGVAEVAFLGRGTHTGNLELGDALSLPATGRSATLPFRDRLRFRDGLIVSAELDFDIEEMKRRLLGRT